MNIFCIIIAIVELIKYKVLVFSQISRVYVACANLCYIIVELTPEVLLFAEPWQILFLHNMVGIVAERTNFKFSLDHH